LAQVLRYLWAKGGGGVSPTRNRRAVSPRASASPLGPKTSSATMAITNASGAPTPRNDACTSCAGARPSAFSCTPECRKQPQARNAGAPDRILSAAASTDVHGAEPAAALREAHHAAQNPRRSAACLARTAKHHAQQAPCKTELFSEPQRDVKAKEPQGAVLHEQATTWTSSVALATSKRAATRLLPG